MANVAGNGTAVTGLGGAAGFGEIMVQRADDASLRLDVSDVFQNGFKLGDQTYAANDLYVATNGLISFGAAVSGVQTDLSALAHPFIAAFHADVDTRLDGEGPESGAVWIDVDAAADVVTITWADVGFYRRNASATNTFQIQLFDRGEGAFDLVLRYQNIDWVSGDLQGGWGGLGGWAALAGWQLGGASATWLQASGLEESLLTLPQTVGNTGVAGLWVYEHRLPVTLPGNSGNDLMIGGAANDTLAGGGGNDTLRGRGGADLLDGGAGIDIADYSQARVAICADLSDALRNSGEALGDQFVAIEGLVGSQFADDLTGNALTNRLYGLDGNDTLSDGAGNDLVYGGPGDDLFMAGEGGDLYVGGAGRDCLSFAAAPGAVRFDMQSALQSHGMATGDRVSSVEQVIGSGMNDTIAGNFQPDYLAGGFGDDSLSGRTGNDTLCGGAGSDRLEGGAGADLLSGGPGVDLATYGRATTAIVADLAASEQNHGADAVGDRYLGIEGVEGSAFNDSLFGDQGANLLTGGSGDDVLTGRAGADELQGGAGFDLAGYGSASAAVRASLVTAAGNTGEAGGDQFHLIEGLVGSNFSDVLEGDGAANALFGGLGRDMLIGGGGNDRLSGGDGNDTLAGDVGRDTLEGGTGVDLVDYSRAAAGLVADLALSTLNTGDATNDLYVSIESLRGSAFADRLSGTSGDNRLEGGMGRDSLYGRAGNDVLFGGKGNDVIDAGTGNDLLDGGGGNDRLIGGMGSDHFLHRGSVADGTDLVMDYRASEHDVLIFDGGAASRSHFSISYGKINNIGSSAVAEAFVTHIPSGLILWTVSDGDNLADLLLRIGNATYDLI